MFKKLKQKIQEESGSTPEGNSFNHGPGLASPVSRDPPGGGIQGIKKDSPVRDAGRRESIDSTASADDSTRSKEELLAMLVKRTEQVKRLEGKVSDLAAMIKDKNRNIERLETSLEQSEEVSTQKIKELSEQHESSRALAEEKKEEEFRERLANIEKSKKELEMRLKEADQYKDKYFQRAEEEDELQGLNSQELAKVKHMLLITQEELAIRKTELEEKSQRLETSEKEVKQLENEVMQLTEKLSREKIQSEKLTVDLNNERKQAEQLSTANTSQRTEIASLHQQLTQKSSQLKTLQISYHELQDEHMVAQRNNDVYRHKTSSELAEKDEEISQLRERITTLEQRLQDTSLDGDDRLTAMEAERTTLEKRLEEARQQLIEVKNTWSDKISHLEKQISNLNKKIAEDAVELAEIQQQLTDKERDAERRLAEAQATLNSETERQKREFQIKVEKLQLDNDCLSKDIARSQELADSQRHQLDQQKQQMEAEIIRSKQNFSDRELELQDTIRDLEVKIVSLEKAREKDRTIAQQKIAALESSHDEWLEKEIDTEKQITTLEEQLHKARAESTHHERDSARYHQQLRDSMAEAEQLKEKVASMTVGMEASQKNVEQLQKDMQRIGADFQSISKENSDLLLRNAELSQKIEAGKRDLSEETESYKSELQAKETAIAGLEQSLQDLTADLTAQQQKASQLEAEAATAREQLESAQVEQLKKQLGSLEDQLADRNKTIKVQQQRLIDLKKTLQRELKVQALPNDEPPEPSGLPSASSSASSSTNNLYPPQLEVLMANAQNTNNSDSRTLSTNFQPGLGGGSGAGAGFSNLRRGSKVAAGAERTMQMMTRCSVGRDCLCEHVNFEYLKHVLIKFMTSRETEALHLIRAVAVLLHLSQDEQRVIRDTLEWKMSWGFASRPKLGKGQMAKVIPPSW